MFKAPKSPYLVPYTGRFRVASAPTAPPKDAPDKKACQKALRKVRQDLQDLQRLLYADDRYSLLLVFQALDAGGKDGTIRHVLEGVNPAGCQVSSFKAPSAEELDHDFLWRTSRRLPERGRIGVFNRSHYEEVLVVRVHPGFLKAQKLPRTPKLETLWEERYAAIRCHEEHLARNGTVILKFWLNVSKEEQKQRFLSRLDEPEKNWKFSTSDVEERQHWDEYMVAFEDALNATSRSWAPWYAIPADDKPFMRLKVAEVVRDTMASLKLAWPTVGEAERAVFGEMRERLEGED